MKIIKVESLAISDIKVVNFEGFSDERGYFCETFRLSDIEAIEGIGKFNFIQANESFSKKNVIRGLHFQWNPQMGKLIRTISGHMVDMALDIRVGSPTFGKIIFHDMPQDQKSITGEWIWVPPGFAHGNFFLKDTTIEYFCTGSYNPKCECGISPFSQDLNFDLCDVHLRKIFETIKTGLPLISEKDKGGISLTDWEKDSNSNQFLYQS